MDGYLQRPYGGGPPASFKLLEPEPPKFVPFRKLLNAGDKFYAHALGICLTKKKD